MVVIPLLNLLNGEQPLPTTFAVAQLAESERGAERIKFALAGLSRWARDLEPPDQLRRAQVSGLCSHERGAYLRPRYASSPPDRQLIDGRRPGMRINGHGKRDQGVFGETARHWRAGGGRDLAGDRLGSVVARWCLWLTAAKFS